MWHVESTEERQEERQSSAVAKASKPRDGALESQRLCPRAKEGGAGMISIGRCITSEAGTHVGGVAHQVSSTAA